MAGPPRVGEKYIVGTNYSHERGTVSSVLRKAGASEWEIEGNHGKRYIVKVNNNVSTQKEFRWFAT